MQNPDCRKANCLLIGCGGIGTIAALNLERGGLATVSAVLRSNYAHVVKHGFSIESVDHGNVQEFRPSFRKYEIRIVIYVAPIISFELQVIDESDCISPEYDPQRP